MSDFRSTRPDLGWLEWLLVAAFLSLLFQVFPSLWWKLSAALDPRTWSSDTWFALNLLVLAVLFGIRFGPEGYAGWRRHRDKRRGIRTTRQVFEPDAAEDDAYKERLRRDAEWRERAKNRRPFQ